MPMSEEKNDNQRFAGCALGLLGVFVACPLSFALSFGVLTTIQAPVWMWIVFWILWPTTFLLAIIRVLIEELLK